MAKIMTDSKHYTDIANAIREKTGSTEQMKPSEMPGQIGSIKSYGEGYKAGGNGVLLYATGITHLLDKAIFTDGAELEIYVPNFSDNMEFLAKDTTGLKKLVLRCDNTDGIMNGQQAFIYSSVEILDISQWKRKLSNTTHFASASKLVTIIGAFDLSDTKSTHLFLSSATNLVDVSFVPGTIFVDFSFSGCSMLSDASIQSIVDGYADMTGQTSPTLTVHPTVGAKMTDAQKATLTAKNVTLAY